MMATMTPKKKPSARKTTRPESKSRARNQARPTEAPDRGLEAREAPEVRNARQAEAPDWGEGREALLGWEFTEGRSQS
jgi:hypothetical protein